MTADTSTLNGHLSMVHSVPEPKRQARSLDNVKMARNRGSAEEDITESDLVRQLIFIFGNTTSSDIIDTGNGYQLRPSLVIS